MTGLTVGERVRIAALSMGRTRRNAVARLLRSPLLSWRHGPLATEEFLMVPTDLRGADPSFAAEVAEGSFGLAGAPVVLNGRSPFAVQSPTPEWERELHGFGWLRHLSAARSPDADAMARGLVLDWIATVSRSPHKLAWAPEVVARRILSWVAHAGLLLEGARPRAYEVIMQSASSQLARLSAGWTEAAPGYPRLLVLMALVQGHLSLDQHERRLRPLGQQLAAELDAQIFADGGHISRNPGLLVEILLDLLPLRQCLLRGSRPPPPQIAAAAQRMMGMLRFLRLGDGELARFNGTGARALDSLATVLVYARDTDAVPETAPQSHYARLARGTAVVVVDIGSPPALELAGAAHAGCLSFEMSAGGEPLLANGGAAGFADRDWSPAARASASHNTLVVREESSARLLSSAILNHAIGGTPIVHPDHVEAQIETGQNDATLTATHDGYLRRFGVLHHRTLKLAGDGRAVEGCDRLLPKSGVLRLARDLPFAIHFHAHPDVEVHPGVRAGTVEFVQPSGTTWVLSADGAIATLEDGTYYADGAGLRSVLQAVLRGVTAGQSEVAWRLERIDAGRTARATTATADTLAGRLAATRAET